MIPIPDKFRENEIFSFLTLNFDIAKAKKMMVEKKVRWMKAKPKMALPMINVDVKYAMTTDLKLPLIFIEHQIKDTTYIMLIDGYHRLTKAVKLNKNIRYVVFTLEEKFKFELSVDEVHKIQKDSKILKNGIMVKK